MIHSIMVNLLVVQLINLALMVLINVLKLALVNRWWPTKISRYQTPLLVDAPLSPLLDPLEGQIMSSCGKLGLEGRSRLPALKGG
jgi:hypothetical protein